MKEKLENKVKYWSKQEKEMIARWLREDKKTHRESIIRIRSKIEAYQEIMEIINQ